MKAGSAGRNTGAVKIGAAKRDRKPHGIAEDVAAQREEGASAEIEVEQSVGALRESGPGVSARAGKVDDRGREFRIGVTDRGEPRIRCGNIPLNMDRIAADQVQIA